MTRRTGVEQLQLSDEERNPSSQSQPKTETILHKATDVDEEDNIDVLDAPVECETATLTTDGDQHHFQSTEVLINMMDKQLLISAHGDRMPFLETLDPPNGFYHVGDDDVWSAYPRGCDIPSATFPIDDDKTRAPMEPYVVALADVLHYTMNVILHTHFRGTHSSQTYSSASGIRQCMTEIVTDDMQHIRFLNAMHKAYYSGIDKYCELGKFQHQVDIITRSVVYDDVLHAGIRRQYMKPGRTSDNDAIEFVTLPAMLHVVYTHYLVLETAKHRLRTFEHEERRVAKRQASRRKGTEW